MICPACKKDMIVVEYRHIELDYCPTCRGVWFDCGELELMLQTSNIDRTCIGEINNLPVAQTTEKARKCPICHDTMSKNTIGQQTPIIIDVCRRYDGLFFDGGELHELVKQIPGEPGKENPVIGFLGEVFKATG
jgi:Zn-finger nucleic acid-binding protein